MFVMRVMFLINVITCKVKRQLIEERKNTFSWTARCVRARRACMRGQSGRRDFAWACSSSLRCSQRASRNYENCLLMMLSFSKPFIVANKADTIARLNLLNRDT